MSDTDWLKRKFKEVFDKEAEVCITVPGRVNIIGEHVDYSGFAVLPMALQRNVTVLASLEHSASGDPPTLRLANTDSSHPSHHRTLTSDLSIDYKKDGWGSYFMCGVKGALEIMENHTTPGIGMAALVHGTVPPGAGLSSSSALVCAAFLTTTSLYKMEVSMKEAAARCACCERYIGTEGGGMDQAIALLASPGCAKLVEFEPELRAVDVCLPNDAVFVVAHSGATKNKAASSEFNSRVAECRIAAQLLSKHAGLDWKSVRKLKHVLDALKLPLDEAPALVKRYLKRTVYSKLQICEELQISCSELDELCLSENTRHLESFRLAQRALHVYQEVERVYQWQKAAELGDLVKMGVLMNSSHISLRDLYECSHPRVDTLVQACIDAGAHGARITGAGWGGCVVALTTTSQADEFIAQVKETFYEGRDCDDLIFPTHPAEGATILRL